MLFKHFSSTLLIVFSLAFCSCDKNTKTISKASDYEMYLDYDPSKELQALQINIDFWNDKIEHAPDQFPYNVKLSTYYNEVFNKTGNIEYLIAAAAALETANQKTNHNHAGYLRALAHNYISQHKFKDALNLLQQAESTGEKLAQTQKMLFDVYLELGNFTSAENYLNLIKNTDDFDYLIRASKWSDHQGNLDFAIYFMEQALNQSVEKNAKSLMQWSHTNLADFYGHAGRVEDAYKHYLKALNIDPSDPYAKKGIAWIVYSHDRQPDEAIRILNSIQRHYQAPDYHLLKAEIAEFASNNHAKLEHINQYTSMVDNTQYGVMYDAYDALLNAEEMGNPMLAIKIAQLEVDARPTPKSYDLLAWAYFNANNINKAYEIIVLKVAGKTTEPDVLFHIASIYKAKGKEKEKNILKQELLTSVFELGPVMEQKINLL